jgi:hypothetical protein
VPAVAPPTELPLPAVAGLPLLAVPALLAPLPPLEGVPLVEMVPADAPAMGPLVLVPALPPTPSAGGSSAEHARLQTPEKIPA